MSLPLRILVTLVIVGFFNVGCGEKNSYGKVTAEIVDVQIGVAEMAEDLAAGEIDERGALEIMDELIDRFDDATERMDALGEPSMDELKQFHGDMKTASKRLGVAARKAKNSGNLTEAINSAVNKLSLESSRKRRGK